MVVILVVAAVILSYCACDELDTEM